jgi:hypothetical protein
MDYKTRPYLKKKKKKKKEFGGKKHKTINISDSKISFP